MNPRSHPLATVLVGLALLFSPHFAGARGRERPVTVFLLRHAETESSPADPRDPRLSEAGTTRAQALARLLSRSGATRLFCSEYERTRATLEPLAELLKVQIERVSARSPEDQVAALEELPPGAVAIVAGHSNTLPALASALGVELPDIESDPRHGPVLRHEDYDRLFSLTLPVGEGAAPKVVELRYGD